MVKLSMYERLPLKDCELSVSGGELAKTGKLLVEMLWKSLQSQKKIGSLGPFPSLPSMSLSHFPMQASGS